VVVWIVNNKEWLFGGVGVAVISGIMTLVWRYRTGSSQNQKGGVNSTNVQAGRDISLNEGPSKPNDG
jgi:hypothetical protein